MIFDEIISQGRAWVKGLFTVGTDDSVENFAAHIKADDALILQSRTDSYPEGNSKPVLELRNNCDPEHSDGAGGGIRWTSFNTSFVRKISGWLNAGLIRNVSGSEDSCIDLGIHHNGQWKVFAIRADSDAVIPPDDKVWSLGLPEKKWKMLCGPLMCLPGNDGNHSVEFKWVYPPGVIEVYIDGTIVKTI